VAVTVHNFLQGNRLTLVVVMIEGNPIAAVTSHRATQLNAEGEAAIGRNAVWAGHLERNLAELEQRLEVSQPKSYQSAARSLKAARSLIHASELLASDDKLQMLGVLDEAKKLLNTRNAVIHAVIGSSMSPGAVTFRGKPEDPDRFLNADELDSIAKQLHETAWNVFDCSMVVVEVFGKARRSKSPQQSDSWVGSKSQMLFSSTEMWGNH